MPAAVRPHATQRGVQREGEQGRHQRVALLAPLRFGNTVRAIAGLPHITELACLPQSAESGESILMRMASRLEIIRKLLCQRARNKPAQEVTNDEAARLRVATKKRSSFFREDAARQDLRV